MRRITKSLIFLGVFVILSVAMIGTIVIVEHTEDNSEGDGKENTNFSTLGGDEKANSISFEQRSGSQEKEMTNEEMVESWGGEPISQNNGFGTMDSPELYFHVVNEINFDLRVFIEDGVTITIPEVKMSSSAEWKDVTALPNGEVLYDENSYDMLYYEGIFVDSYGSSNQGWVISREGEDLYLDDVIVEIPDIIEFLRYQMCLSGLEDNEIDFMIERIGSLDMLNFEEDHLLIRYIPISSVDEAIDLEVRDEFQIMRRHFLIESTDEIIQLVEPIFEETPEGPYVIHETAINRI